MKNQQIRELLTRIPASPERDELQNLFESMERDRLLKMANIRDALQDAESGLILAVALAKEHRINTPNGTIQKALAATRKGLQETLG